MGESGLSDWNHLYVQQTAIKQFSSWRHKNMWSLSDIGCLRDFNICSKLHFSTSNTVFNIIILCSLHLTFQTCLITDICFHHLPPSPSLLCFFPFLLWPPGGALHLCRMAPTSMLKTCRRWQRCTGWLSAATGRWPSSRWGTKQTSTASASSTRRLWTSPWIPATLSWWYCYRWTDGWWGDTLGERETDRVERKTKKGHRWIRCQSETDGWRVGRRGWMKTEREREGKEKETPRRWWREEKLMTGKNRYRRTDNWEGKRRVRHAGRRTEKQRRVKSGQLSFSNTKHVVARLLNKIRERETLGEEKTENDPADFSQCR